MRRLVLLLLVVGCGRAVDDFDGDGVVDVLDCAPQDAERHPGAADPPGDGVDGDCDGADGTDNDGDGFVGNLPAGDPLRDCDDERADAYPGAEELPGNGADEDCDGQDGDDRDGDGTPDATDCAPDDPTLDGLDRDSDGASLCAGDCDDLDPARNLRDLDGDGVDTCSGDCDDASAARFPAAGEVCDGLDDDCDGAVPADEVDGDEDGVAPCAGDCDDLDAGVSPLDADGDGAAGCDALPDCDDDEPALDPFDADLDGWSSCAGDCDDADAGRYPGQPEGCDGVDTDCSGLPAADEVDADGDGALACADCDDGDAAVVGVDQDQDGFDPCAGDCDEADPATFPLAADPWGDGADQSCDGVDGNDFDRDGWAANAPVGERDCDDENASLGRDDADGDGVDTCGGDCDDGDAARFPGQVEDACDGIDSDCAIDPQEVDSDGDGAAPCAGDCDDVDPQIGLMDLDGDGASACVDCDDGDGAIRPGRLVDTLGDGIDSNCDGHDGYRLDHADVVIDGDHFGFLGFGATAGAFGGGDGADLALGAPLDTDPPGSGTVRIFTQDQLVPGARLTGADARLVLRGGAAHQRFGGSLAVVPDLDGDGLDELLVGGGDESQYYDPALGSGGVTLVPGAALDADGDTDVEPSWWGIPRAANQMLGWRVAVTDLDGGGPDLVITAGAYVGATWGAVAIRHDATAALSGAVTLADPSLRRIAADGAAHSLGASLATGGDWDGDGRPDLLVGAPQATFSGAAYVFTAAGLDAAGDRSTGAAQLTLHADLGSAFFGDDVAWIPDLDGDGRDEIAVSDGQRSDGALARGAVHVFLSSTVGAASSVYGDEADATLLGPEPWSFLGRGRALHGLPDLDGDGAADLLLGAPFANGPAAAAGHGYLVSGLALLAGGTVDVTDVAYTTFVGSAEAEGLTMSASVLPDLDGDGLPELGFSSPMWPDVSTRAGRFALVMP